jgi:signal transduction histidine kinase
VTPFEPTLRPPWAGRPHWSGRRFSLAAVVVTIVQLAGTYAAAYHQPTTHDIDAFALVLLTGTGLALFFRRRHPVAVLTTIAAAIVVYHARGYPNGPIFLSLVVAIVHAIFSGHRRATWAVAGGAWLAYSALGVVGATDGPTLNESIGIAVWLLLVLVLAEFARTRRDQAIAGFRARADEERRRRSEERLRVAQELHDVLAHNISLINVQAGVALHLMDEQPEQARTALTAIKQASKEALGELRSVLGVLREADDEAPRSPAPGLARLDGLVAQAAAAGLRVDVGVDGEARPLAAPVDLAAYRIIQEALTNATKHAGPTAVHVTIHYGGDDVTVVVDDEGGAHPVTVPGSGRGLVGMRERAEALGGRFASGPRPAGGYHVAATLPTEPAP